MLGKLVGVGVGPGNPELLTYKAVKILMNMDVICTPKASLEKRSLALETVKPFLQGLEKPPEILELVFPMVKDAETLRENWKKNAEIIITKLEEGKNVAFITLGDPMFYSTFIYIYEAIVEKRPEFEVEIVPGITSLTACAAVSKVPVAKAEETVAVVPANTPLRKIISMTKNVDTLVFMKGTKRLKKLLETLARYGFNEDSPVVMVKKAGVSMEEVKTGKLKDLQNWDIDAYFSTVIIKRR